MKEYENKVQIFKEEPSSYVETKRFPIIESCFTKFLKEDSRAEISRGPFPDISRILRHASSGTCPTKELRVGICGELMN
jgi:hypothetical protein